MRKIPTFMARGLVETGEVYYQNESGDFIRIQEDLSNHFNGLEGYRLYTNLSETALQKLVPSMIVHESSTDFKKETLKLREENQSLLNVVRYAASYDYHDWDPEELAEMASKTLRRFKK